MITTLHIKNIGIIDDLEFELNNGFNVFTGETGAGKTLIIGAINIICGGRFSKEMIRKGEDHSFVELNLYLPDNENSIDGNIIISREIHSNGKNSCKINGRLVTVNELKEFMNNIIDIHGQNDNQRILDENFHVKYLDNFGDPNLLKTLSIYKEKYHEYCAKRRELKSNFGDDRERKRELDLLQYEFDEIEKADLKIGEDDELKNKSIIFENSEKIVKSLSESTSNCEKSVDFINNSIKAMDKISHIDKNYARKLSELKNIYYEIEEFSRDISSMNDEVNFDQSERDEVEERLDTIANLKRKYGNSIKEIIAFKDECQNKIDKIQGLEEYNEKLKLEIKEIEKELELYATKIHEYRIKTAQVLIEKINNELHDLEMTNAMFNVAIDKKDCFDKNGFDDVKFMISTNKGEDEKPLQKIASGGEMSRIMLAIKTVLANTDKTPVMIFDEIDTGISGKAAKSVAKKLKLIGKNHQVICITHQPSIAAKGDQNYYISKVAIGERTHTMIKKLNENEIIDEIARISNGEITDIARKHAEELRKSA